MRILTVIGATAGFAAAVFLFDRAAIALAGTTWTWTAHVALAALGALILLAALRLRRGRAVLAGLGLGLLALTAASALVAPALIRAEALKTAVGRPFCLVGPEVSVDPEGRRRDPYVLSPSPAGRLTLLTLPRPLTLVILRESDSPEDGPGGKPDSLFMPFDWDSLSRRFREGEYAHLRDPGESRLVDCLPQADPFTASAASEGPAALVVWRDPVRAADGSTGWGPRRQAILRLPADAAPLHYGRFSSGRAGFDLALLPDADTLPVTLTWVPDLADWLDRRRLEQVRDKDQPLDWTALPVTTTGLVAYEVPSTSVADGIDGTYLRPGPDGLPLTVIACDTFFCRHHFRLDPAAPVVVSLTYPVALLARWQEIETSARRETGGMIRFDG